MGECIDDATGQMGWCKATGFFVFAIVAITAFLAALMSWGVGWLVVQFRTNRRVPALGWWIIVVVVLLFAITGYEWTRPGMV